MKYELNKTYDFMVRDVVESNGILNFMVDVEGNMFPVKAYMEQIENSIPSSVSCRIMQDKNKDAYLVQNEATFYPSLYKQNHRYLFEVTEILDKYAILKDKYGLYHTMFFDGTKLSLNEIIVRCVKVIIEDNIKAHLDFYYTELVSKDVPQETCKIITEPQVLPVYSPTIFEEDEPKTKTIVQQSSLPTFPHNSNMIDIANEIGEIEKRTDVSLTTLLCTKDWEQLRIYFDKNLEKGKIPSILKQIAQTIEICMSGTQYWETVQFLLKYDARTFLGTLATINVSTIDGIDAPIKENILEDVITYAFSVSDKLKYSLELIRPCASYLTIKQQNYIQAKCTELNNPESFIVLFKILRLSPENAIAFLLSLKDNIAAAYTLYKFYLDSKNGKRISEHSRIQAFNPSNIYAYTQFMNKMKSDPFSLSATLINSNILLKGLCPADLQKAVDKEGYNGFYMYVIKKKQMKETAATKQLVESLSTGDYLYDLTYKTQTDNYYIMRSSKLSFYALLDKNLTDVTPNGDCKITAKIVKVMRNKNCKVFIVSQKKSVPTLYSYPPLFNNSTLLKLSFHDNGNSNYTPEIKNLRGLINIEIEKQLLPTSFKYNSVHEAKIIRRMDFFTYFVKITNSDSSVSV